MELVHTCKKLTAIYHEDGFAFGGPHKVELEISRSTVIKIIIEQCYTRTITIIATDEVPVHELHSVFSRLERLLMMFDGRFYTLESLTLSDSISTSNSRLKNSETHIINSRLPYFRSADFFKCHSNKLIDAHAILTVEVFKKWNDLLDELDIRHQIFLYSICDNKLPIDMNFAFLIEQAEPLVEIIKSQKHIWRDMNPGQEGTSLKKCIKRLIRKYGATIFQNELTDNYNDFLQQLVASRVRIMHIKSNQRGTYIVKAKDIILYSVKMYLLYRCVIFDLLGIDSSIYQHRLEQCIGTWDRWNNQP